MVHAKTKLRAIILVVLLVGTQSGNALAGPAPAPAVTITAADLRAGRCSPLPGDPAARKNYARSYYRHGIALAARAKMLLAKTAMRCSFLAFAHGFTYFNHAKLSEKLAHYPDAVRSYRRYLKLIPGANDRIEVEEKIELLLDAILLQKKARVAKLRVIRVKKLMKRLAREKAAATKTADLEAARSRELKAQRKLALLRAQVATLKAAQMNAALRIAKTKASTELRALASEHATVTSKIRQTSQKLHTAAWLAGTFGVLATITSGVFFGLAVSTKSTVETGLEGTPWTGDISSAHRRNKTYNLISIISGGTGALLLTTAIVLSVLSSRSLGEHSKVDRTSHLPVIQPILSPNGGGLVVTLAF